MTKKYDYLVYFGRFQPFTKAHLSVIKQAIDMADHVIVMIGSHNSPRTMRNPWQSEEIMSMISRSLTAEEGIPLSSVTLQPMEDCLYQDNLWAETALNAVNVVIEKTGNYPNDVSVGLIGHAKDSTSYYLTMFPTWGAVNVDNYEGINATAARNGYFSNICDEWLHAAEDMVPWEVISYLMAWKRTPMYEEVLADHEHILKLREEFGHGPFLTGDALVMQAGHVLMIRRGERPNRGYWALPGGFVNVGETMAETAIRELYEETSLDIPKGAIRSCHKATHTFDEPFRDPRSRVVTMVQAFDISHELKRTMKHHGAWTTGDPIPLTKIKAGDDAAYAAWVPIASLKRNGVFADHYDIIQVMRSKM